VHSLQYQVFENHREQDREATQDGEHRQTAIKINWANITSTLRAFQDTVINWTEDIFDMVGDGAELASPNTVEFSSLSMALTMDMNIVNFPRPATL
jgi:hypothetical protein